VEDAIHEHLRSLTRTGKCSTTAFGGEKDITAMAGSSGSGQDIESGRTNMAESTTVVQGGRPSELNVPFNGLAVFEAGARRDDQRPDRTLNGVLGRGWNGAASPADRQPGAGVIGVGAPNHGPGMVGLGGGIRISSTFLGSPGNLGEDGLGGTGVIGIGGQGDSAASATAADVAADPSRPGAGLVGQGGASLFPTGGSPTGTGNGPGVVGIAGGRQRPPVADMSQADLAATENVGVVGFGGDGPKPFGGTTVGPVSAGPGVRGIGGIATPSGTTTTIAGPGVVGVAGTAPVPSDATVAEIGVAGFGGAGAGVFGMSTAFPGVAGTSTSASGVVGTSTAGAGIVGTSLTGPGVVGISGGTNGGAFSSSVAAQINLRPLPTPLATPTGAIAGRAGDLLVLTPRPDGLMATLWFCTTTGDATTATWVRIV
jgi:hypothetical protein